MQKEEKIVRGADLATTGQKIKSYVLEQIADKVSSDDIDNVVELTKAQYDALATKDARTMYIISDSAVDSDHVGIAKFEQTTKSTAPGGTNIWTVTLTNNQTFTLAVMNGTQGNSGYSGAAGELEVVNNVTQGGATAALSAEMGKQLEGEISQLGLEVNGNIDLGQWEVGSIGYPANGHIPDYSSTTRLRISEKVCSLTSNYTITCNPGYLFLIYVVGKITTSSWVSSREVSMVAGDIYRIAIKADPETSFSGYTQEQVDAVIATSDIKMCLEGVIQRIDELEIATDNQERRIEVLETELDTITYPLTEEGYYNSNGVLVTSSNARNTGYVTIRDENAYLSYRSLISSSGCAIAFYTLDKTFISSISIVGKNKWDEGVINLSDSAYNNAVYFIVSVYGSSNFGSAYAKTTSVDAIQPRLATVEKAISSQTYQPIFNFPGYISLQSGVRAANSAYRCTPFLEYISGGIDIKNSYNGTSSYVIAFYDATKTFISGVAGSNVNTPTEYNIDSTNIPSGTKYFRLGTKIGTELTSVTYSGINGIIMQDSTAQPKSKIKMLIFGDSITDCASLTINSSDETTAYSWQDPSNNYTDGQGHTIYYDMWPFLVNNYFNAFDIRNYAKSGASYKDATRASGNERQNLSYQIEVAFNDLANPNNVFPTTGEFVPDVVIFALGTNDGTPNDTYDSAMAKTIMNQAGTAVDISATLANLDLTNFNEAMRYAFLKVKAQFPYALTFCVLPIQRVSADVTGALHDAIKRMAEHYSIMVIDGAFQSGICRELETASGLGDCLKDGLHPNDKGQNLLTRLIISAIESNWVNPEWLN